MKLYSLYLIKFDDDYKNTRDTYLYLLFKSKGEAIKYVSDEIKIYIEERMHEKNEEFNKYFEYVDYKKNPVCGSFKEECINEYDLNKILDMFPCEYRNNNKMMFEIEEIDTDKL